jgi:Tfp pilus assembly protein PilN
MTDPHAESRTSELPQRITAPLPLLPPQPPSRPRRSWVLIAGIAVLALWAILATGLLTVEATAHYKTEQALAAEKATVAKRDKEISRLNTALQAAEQRANAAQQPKGLQDCLTDELKKLLPPLGLP